MGSAWVLNVRLQPSTRPWVFEKLLPRFILHSARRAGIMRDQLPCSFENIDALRLTPAALPPAARPALAFTEGDVP